MAEQMFEQQKGQLEGSFRETCEAKLGEWKAGRSASSWMPLMEAGRRWLSSTRRSTSAIFIILLAILDD